MPVRALLVDLDGTLIEAFAPIVRGVHAACAALGIPAPSPEEVRRRTGRGGGHLRALFGKKAEAAMRIFYEVHDAHLLDVAAKPGAAALLAAVRRWGWKVAVVTSKTEPRARAQLAHLGLLAYLDALVGRTAQRPQKPDPAPVRLACARLGVAPEQAVMLGDGIADMEAAARAGCTPLGLVGHYSAAELLAAGAVDCVADLVEAKQWLARNFGA